MKNFSLILFVFSFCSQLYAKTLLVSQEKSHEQIMTFSLNTKAPLIRLSQRWTNKVCYIGEAKEASEIVEKMAQNEGVPRLKQCDEEGHCFDDIFIVQWSPNQVRVHAEVYGVHGGYNIHSQFFGEMFKRINPCSAN